MITREAWTPLKLWSTLYADVNKIHKSRSIPKKIGEIGLKTTPMRWNWFISKVNCHFWININFSRLHCQTFFSKHRVMNNKARQWSHYLVWRKIFERRFLQVGMPEFLKYFIETSNSPKFPLFLSQQGYAVLLLGGFSNLHSILYPASFAIKGAPTSSYDGSSLGEKKLQKKWIAFWKLAFEWFRKFINRLR